MTDDNPKAPLRPGLPHHPAGAPALGAHPSLLAVLDWYFHQSHTHQEDPGSLPFYCDPSYVGAFAVDPEELAAGQDAAIFRLFVLLSMYQALRDVVIMRQQREFSGHSLQVIADPESIEHSVAVHPCSAFRTAEEFETRCNVMKLGKVVDCGRCPDVPCHVKDATVAFRRMGDMGKLPTSAWLRLWKPGGISAVLAEVRDQESSPTQRAELLVERLERVHRVGRKLATLIVSALSTPALAPGLTPWFPEIDGNILVVVDTNVARAVDALRGPGGANTYKAREHWVREQAALIDLRNFRADLPSYSPRIVQQALYAFCSKSNRTARGDACAASANECTGCLPTLCPFGSSNASTSGATRKMRPERPA